MHFILRLCLLILLSGPLVWAGGPGEDATDPYFTPMAQEALWTLGTVTPRNSTDPSFSNLFRVQDGDWLGPALARSHADIVVFGERHVDDPEVADALIGVLADLRAQGFEVLGMEMFNSSSQGALDRFCQGTLSKNELRVILQAQWTHAPDSYISLVEEARRVGLRVIALDGRDQLARRLTEVSFARGLALRDQHMARVISERLKISDGRWVLLTGAQHAVKKRAGDREFRTVSEYLAEQRPALRIENYLFVSTRDRRSPRLKILEKFAAPLDPFVYRVAQPYADGFVRVLRAPE